MRGSENNLLANRKVPDLQYVTLNNGLQMLILGFGVFQIPDPAECKAQRCRCHRRRVSPDSPITASRRQNEFVFVSKTSNEPPRRHSQAQEGDAAPDFAVDYQEN